MSWLLNLTSLASSLDTGTEYVRSRLAKYANDLLSLGIDGFRLDAAKSKGSYVNLNRDGQMLNPC